MSIKTPFFNCTIHASGLSASLLGRVQCGSQTLKSKAFAQGFRAAAEDPEGAQMWLELFEEKSE